MGRERRTLTISESEKGRFTGVLVMPEAAPAPGIVLMSGVFGVTAAVVGLAESYAAQGYAVLAPDMFWRAGENLTFGEDARRDAGDAFLLAGGSVGHKQNFDAAAEALRALADCTGKLAAVGFGVGALTAFAAATANQVDAAISFYPAILPLADAAKLATPWQYHYAEADRFVRDNLLGDVAALFAENPRVDIRTYPGAAHGFAMPGAPGYDETAARGAFAASIDFLAAALDVTRGEP